MPIIHMSASPAVQLEKKLALINVNLMDKAANPEDEFLPCDLAMLMGIFHTVGEITVDLEAKISALWQRVTSLETLVADHTTKPVVSTDAVLDQRQTATAALLRAALVRLERVEQAMTVLYNPPFHKIDPNDTDKNQLEALKVEFDVIFPTPL